MTENNKHQGNNILFREVDRTMYEIMVKQSDNANESVEDILVRLIAEDPVFRKGAYANG